MNYLKKADTALQNYYRREDLRCICGKKSSVIHHYYPKSVSSSLRYEPLNLIPLCQGCHFRLHNAQDPRLSEAIIKMMGEERLKALRKKAHIFKRWKVSELKQLIKTYDSTTVSQD